MVMVQGQISTMALEKRAGELRQREMQNLPPSTSSLPRPSSALVSHLYKVFLTHGLPNDTFCPATYSIGEIVLENSG